MSTIYTRCPDNVYNLVAWVLETLHPELKNAGVTLDVLFAANPEGGAVKWQGYNAAAVISIVSLKHRALDHADAELVIDEEQWKQMSDNQRRALIDHELEHMEVSKDNQGNVKTDDLDRPKLTMKLHDWMTGGFDAVARRWGEDAAEVQGGRKLTNRLSQLNLPLEPAAQ